MKLIIKILLSPIVLAIDLLTWIFVGLISCSSILFRLASSIVALLGIAVLTTYSVKNAEYFRHDQEPVIPKSCCKCSDFVLYSLHIISLGGCP